MPDDDLRHVDLRPSPWIIHRWVLGVVGAGYAAFALAVLGAPHRSGLARALAEAVVILVGGCVVACAALASAMIALCARRRHPLLTAYGVTAAIVGALVTLWTRSP